MSGWIRVRDRLPERDGTYLVFSDAGAVYANHFYSRFGRFSKRGKRHITHWMPMPEPPEEEA